MTCRGGTWRNLSKPFLRLSSNLMSIITTRVCDSQRARFRISLLSGIRRRSSAVFGITARKGSFSLVDQVVVSGASFLTTVLVGRICGLEELATYSLGFSLVILILSVLETLIVLPYTIYAIRFDGAAQAEYRGAVLVQCGLLSVLATLMLAVWATVISTGLRPLGLAPVLYMLSAAIPFCMLKEFARRFAFAHLNSEKALQLDLSTATLQIIGIAILAAGGLLSAVTATAVIGLANAAVALTWLILSRSNFVVRRNQILPAMWRNLSFGRWLLASRMVGHLNSDILVLWLLAFFLGQAATGVFAACMTVVQFSNPFVLGVGQVLTPRIARALADSGVKEVQRVAWKATILVGLVLSAFCIGTLLFGDMAMKTIYGGQYGGHSYSITVLAASILACALGSPAAASLLALERPDVSLKASVVGLFFTVTFASALVLHLGVLGVACGLLAGQIGASTIRWAAFTRLAMKKPLQGS